MLKDIVILSCLFSVVVSVRAQCPDRDLLQRRLNYIDSAYLRYSQSPPRSQVTALLGYLENMNSCSYRNDSTHASLLRRIGRIFLLEGDFIKGIKYYTQAIDVTKNKVNKASAGPETLAGCYFWLSMAYHALDNSGEMMKALDSCIAISMRLKHIDRSTLKSMEIRTQYFFDVGDYQRCIDYAVRWGALGEEYSNNNSGREHSVGESSVKSSLGWQVKALLQLKKFEQAEKLLKNKIEQFRKEGLQDYLGMIYSLLAEGQLQKGDDAKALFYNNQALNYYRSAGDQFNCKQVAKDIGKIYFTRFNDAEKAFTYYRKAFTFINADSSKNTADLFESLSLFANIGDIYVEKGLYDSAYRYYQFAFDQIKHGIDENGIILSTPEEFIKYKKIHYLTSLQIDKGDAFRKQYKSMGVTSALKTAIHIYRKTDLLLDRIKGEQSELESKLFWRSDTRRLYEHAIDACYLSGDIENAVYFFEKSRAVLLNDQLNEQHWVSEQDILKQTQLKKKIQQLTMNVNVTDKSSRQYSDLQSELFTSKQDLEKLQNIIKVNNPLYYQNFVDSNLITIKDVREKILKDHQALVEIFAGDSAVYSLIITVNKNYLQKIDKPIFDSLSTLYSRAISDPEWLNKNFTSFFKVSHQLYQLLFRKSSLPPGRIIISPDGQSFPFEALITDVKTRNYFLYDHAVSYTYSARYLLNEFNQNNSSSSHDFFGIAPVQYSNGLPALQGSDESLYRMQKYFRKAKTLVLSKASKNNFLNQFDNYGIIQMYAHATDSGYNGEPTIDFFDSTLSLSDLFYSKKPATNLIVLSACETALGELHPGEGVFSFNRGFAALGIPSAVSNLWRVDNKATYRLTELFYKYVADGVALDIALQKAKKEFMQTAVSSENKLPYYWAASILVGQSNEIILQKPFPWKWVAALVILLILGFFGWQLKRKWPSGQLRIKREFLRE